MTVGTSELLVHDPVFDEDQESGETGTMVSSLSLRLQTKKQRFFKPVSEMTLNEQVTAIVAWFTIILSLCAMIIEGSIYVIVSGLLSMVMGSYAHYQQIQLTKVAYLKERSSALEGDITRLESDNTRLSYDVDELEGRVEDLLDVEDALELISERQSMDALQKDADDNLEKVCRMKQSAKASVIETLVSSMCSRKRDGETDGDMLITGEDTVRMIQQLHNIAGLSFDEGRLRNTVVGKPIESIVDALQNLLDEDIPAMNRIFQVK